MTSPEALMARAKALKLYGLLAHWEAVATSDWVAPLIGWDEDERARRGLERRLGNAHLGRFKPLADFDWNWPTQCDRTAIEDLMGLRFLAEAANVVLIGPNGVGKSMVARNIAHRAVLAGYTVLCSPAPDICGTMAGADGDIENGGSKAIFNPLTLALSRRAREFNVALLLQCSIPSPSNPLRNPWVSIASTPSVGGIASRTER